MTPILQVWLKQNKETALSDDKSNHMLALLVQLNLGTGKQKIEIQLCRVIIWKLTVTYLLLQGKKI